MVGGDGDGWRSERDVVIKECDLDMQDNGKTQFMLPSLTACSIHFTIRSTSSLIFMHSAFNRGSTSASRQAWATACVLWRKRTHLGP